MRSVTREELERRLNAQHREFMETVANLRQRVSGLEDALAQKMQQ